MNQKPRKNGQGTITMEDIRSHMARFGRDIPFALPLTSGIDEEGAAKKPPAEKSPGLAPLDTSGLQRALIHNPRDVNSPY